MELYGNRAKQKRHGAKVRGDSKLRLYLAQKFSDARLRPGRQEILGEERSYQLFSALPDFAGPAP